MRIAATAQEPPKRRQGSFRSVRVPPASPEKTLAAHRAAGLKSTYVRPPRDAAAQPSARRRPCPSMAYGMKAAMRP